MFLSAAAAATVAATAEATATATACYCSVQRELHRFAIIGPTTFNFVKERYNINMATKTVIKLNNIPHGFYEEQMRSYFSQFGKVRNVLLVRSRKTHKSRGFGFVEFILPQVAKAAAEAMHNYLFFNQVLKCRQMDRNDLPKNLFKIKYKGPTSVEADKLRQSSSKKSVKKLRQLYKKILTIQDLVRESGASKFKCYVINSPE